MIDIHIIDPFWWLFCVFLFFTELTDYLFDLIYDRNYRIKNLCTVALDLIAEEHPELSAKIKHEKFSSYNAKWLNVIQTDRSSDEQSNQSALEDMFLYPDLFLKMDILNDSSSDNLSEIESWFETNFLL